MSAITTVAKIAFPIAVIGVLSGSYYYLTFWPTPPERLQISPSIQNDSPNRLQPYQSPIRNLPSQGFNANLRSQRPTQDYAVRTTAGEFTEDQNLAQTPSTGLSLDRALDDFELTIQQLHLEQNSSVSALGETKQSDPARTSEGVGLSEPRALQAVQSQASKSPAMDPVPVGSRNGQLISNPYLTQLNQQTPPSEPPHQQNTAAHRSQISETAVDAAIGSTTDFGVTNSGVPNSGDLPLFTETQHPISGNTETGQTVQSLNNTVVEQANKTAIRSILEPPTTERDQRQDNGNARSGMRPVVPLYLGQAVTSQIQTHLDYGNSLARRSATLLAKREFTKGLRIIAEASDNQLGSNSHLRALQEGFTALREAADFDNAEGVFEFDTQKIAAAHDTPIIRDGHFDPNTPSQARKAYMLFAQDRIVQAVSKHAVAAELLHALGKTYLVDAVYGTNPQRLDFARAAVLFQSSLIVNPQHVKSANELGVILARSGRLTDAKILFQNAIRADVRFSEGWNNLSKVHQRLGETEFAQLAAQEAEQTGVNQTAEVRLVQHEEFNNLSGAWGLPSAQNVQSIPTPPIENDHAQQEASKKRPSFTPDLKPADKSERNWFQPKKKVTAEQNEPSAAPRSTFRSFGGF